MTDLPLNAVYVIVPGKYFDWRGGLMTHKKFVAKYGKTAAFAAPRLDSFVMNAHLSYGVMQDELGRNVLNLGAMGAMLLICHLGRITERSVDKVFANSSDREDFWEWATNTAHLWNETAPGADRPDLRALLMLEAEGNAGLYRLLGFPECVLPER